MFNIHQLSAAVESVQEIPPQNVATATTTNGTGVNMIGWDGVLFNIDVGVLGTSATANFYATSSVNANYSGEANINYANGTLASINVPNANANVHAVLDFFRPSQEFVRLKAVSTTTNGVALSASSTRYRASGILPPTHAAFSTVFVQIS